MIREEIIPHRIRDLLAACENQHEMVKRLIVEVEPGFQSSRLRMILDNRTWPCAVNPNLIINKDSPQDQLARGESILSQLVSTNIAGSKFLDYGCGMGYVARQAGRQGADSTGYDIEKQWKDQGDCRLTDDWDAVMSRSPYDTVLIYDVLDHTKEEHPIDVLKKIREVMTPDGKLFVRCHPWCSRTGNHSYVYNNKAYIHYFFNSDQLEEMGAPGIFTRKITHPIVTYNDWITKAGFTKVTEDVKRDTMEPFWEEESFLRRLIQDHWKDSYEETLATGVKFPKYQMEITWVDFKLMPGLEKF